MKSEEKIKIHLHLYKELKHHMDHGATYLEALSLIESNNTVKKSLSAEE